MARDRWSEVERILAEALAELPEARSRFVAAACAGDLAMKREVELLLRQGESADRALRLKNTDAKADETVRFTTTTSDTVLLAPAEHVLGHYRVQGQIGRGGMGQVFRATDTRLQRDVAIKVLHGDPTNNERARRRLLREARAAAALSHPSIVTVYSVEEVADRFFIVMELIDGGTLADRLANGALDISDSCEIGAQIAEALAAAHAAGIVHHDVTPRNILLTADGRVKLADFGLSRTVAPRRLSLESTHTGPQLAGTIHYMSPEQVRGEACTDRSDLFSLGSVLYHAATGRRPFDGPNLAAVVDAISSLDPPAPSRVRPDLPSGFDTLVGRLFVKPVDARTIDGMQVARTLRSLKASLSDGGTATSIAVLGARDKTPFVGRTRELARLSNALVDAVAGVGATIVITGDAGMGKTVLLDAFLRDRHTLAANPLVCRGQAVEYSGAGEPYLPIVDALAAMVARPGGRLHEIVRTHAPSWRFQFPAAYPHQDIAATPSTPARLARELGDVLSAAAQSQPVVMVLEDLHWADPSTLELLRHLAYRAKRVALLIVATCRTEEMGEAGSPISDALTDLEARSMSERIELDRLDEESVRHYLECRFGSPEISTPLTPLVARATEGHPLFLVTLMQLFVQRGDLQQHGQVWRLSVPADQLHLEIPRTVQAVIRRKLAGLNAPDRHLLQHASVEGQEFSTAVLSTLISTDAMALEERLEVLTKISRLVIAIGPHRYLDGTWGARYRFAHAVYQNVIYDDLPPSRRAALHRQVAQRLGVLNAGGTTPIAAQLARHFRLGRDAEHAFEHYVQAGDNSMTLSAALEAEGHYSQAVTLAGAEGTTIGPREIALAHWKRAISLAFLGRPLAALVDFRQALTRATEAGDLDLAFDILLATAYAHLFAEQVSEAVAAAAALEPTIEPAPGGSKRLRLLILDLQLTTGRGDLDRAEVVGDAAVTLARALGESVTFSHGLSARAQLAYYRADYSSALSGLREVCSASAALTRRLADPRSLDVRFHGTFFLGRTLGDLGHVSEAISTLQSGLEIARQDGYTYWIPQLLNALGWIYGEIGSFDAALRHDEEAAAEAADQNLELRVESKLNLITDYLHLGRLDSAAGLLAEADVLISKAEYYGWLLRLRYAWIASQDALARGASARALALAQECDALARRHGAWKYVVLAERVLAEATLAQGDWSRAEDHGRHAINVLGSHPIPIIAWTVHATVARIHRRRGRDLQATHALNQARAELHQLSNGILEASLKTTFLQSPDVCRVSADIDAP